jgi:hypothetical protein
VHHDGGDGGTRNSRGNKHRILDIVDYDHIFCRRISVVSSRTTSTSATHHD